MKNFFNQYKWVLVALVAVALVIGAAQGIRSAVRAQGASSSQGETEVLPDDPQAPLPQLPQEDTPVLPQQQDPAATPLPEGSGTSEQEPGQDAQPQEEQPAQPEEGTGEDTEPGGNGETGEDTQQPAVPQEDLHAFELPYLPLS